MLTVVPSQVSTSLPTETRRMFWRKFQLNVIQIHLGGLELRLLGLRSIPALGDVLCHVPSLLDKGAGTAD